MVITRIGVQRVNVALGFFQNRKRGQTQEVELHQANGFDIVLVILRYHRVRTVGNVKWCEIGERARCDQYPTRMHADIARNAFELYRQRQ